MKRWSVLLGCFIGMGVATPALLLQPMGLFVKPVTAEFGWSRTAFSVILSGAALVNALILPLAGYLVDRFGARRVAAVGTTLGCASYAALSLAHSYGGFFALIALAVITGNLASYPAFMGLAQRWFDKRLGLALAITSTGIAVGVGGFSYLLTDSIARYGWRSAFQIAGATALVVGLANLVVLVRDNPGPIPEDERRDRAIDVAQDGHSLAEALRTRDFWLFAVSSLLVILAVVGTNFNLPALLSDRGATASRIASVVAIGSAGSLFGRLVTGVMLDRLPALVVAAIFFGGQAIGLLLLLGDARWALAAAFLLGLVQGAEIDFLGFVIARRFGRVAYARIFGTCFAITLIGAVLGPLVMASIYDRTGSYDLGLMLFPLLPIMALGLLWFARMSAEGAEGSADANG
ncbi:MFS transporter [Sphingomonas sp.]|uniref:MFS transporter n=1 Tax=Sphingomonas sp. TaxID=28214 RepID=UPI0035BC0F98